MAIRQTIRLPEPVLALNERGDVVIRLVHAGEVLGSINMTETVAKVINHFVAPAPDPRAN